MKLQSRKNKMTKLWDTAKLFQCLAIPLILLSMVSASLAQQHYPWETALKKQLEQLNKNYRGRPQDIVVVHLGITDRDEQAYRIAESLSQSLGRPVIAVPSYSGDPRDDLRKSIVQYYNSRTYPVRFERVWEQITTQGHRIVGTIFHSGAGIRGNTERHNLIAFIKENPGKVTGNAVFAMTDLKGLTKKEFSQVGINAVQIGTDDFVSWVTKPAQRYIPFGEYLGPVSTALGWTVKPLAALGKGLSKHPLETREDELVKAIEASSPISTEPSRPTGGIDFASIEPRYLSEFQDGPLYIMGVAFHAIPSKPGQGIDSERLSELSWNSLFVWLALPNSTFWVNLNPAEPDRIIDRELGKTDVGRILLEADFQMKKDLARLTHPKESPLGRQFWDKIYTHIMGSIPTFGPTQIAIPATFRVWIVPGQVVVWATDESIYVVDAQMDVKLESEYPSHTAEAIPSFPLTGTPGSSESQKYAERLLKEMILPALIKEVNNGPQYQELRQVFYSRIIAEWYKTKHRSGKRAFSKIVGQGSTDPWRSAKVWSGQEIFERYKQSLSKGEYSLTEESQMVSGMFIIKTIRKYFTGGVDFMKIPMTKISYEQLLGQKPEIREQLFDALLTATGHCNGGAWIGGIYVAGIAESGNSPDRGYLLGAVAILVVVFFIWRVSSRRRFSRY